MSCGVFLSTYERISSKDLQMSKMWSINTKFLVKYMININQCLWKKVVRFENFEYYRVVGLLVNEQRVVEEDATILFEHEHDFYQEAVIRS